VRATASPAALGGKPTDYRLIVGDIGGGFGMKTGVANEDALVCHAARKLGRPVKWRADRSEDFLAAHMGRDQHYDGELALDREGRILALRVTTYANFGATPVGSTAIIPLVLGPKVQTTVYHVPAVDYRVYGLLTNTMATGAYRGAGRPEANYLMERLIEQAAREMKLDSVEIRRRNFIRPEQFPYKTHVDDWYDAGEFARVLDRALAAADWNGFAARRKESESRGRLRGRGLACYLEWTGAPIRTETVDIQVDADGTVSVYTGTQAMGQGLETTYTQLITEVLQIPAKSVRVIQGDTDAATGVGSVGSRSAFVGGSAAVAAGRRAIVRGKELAAEALESSIADIEYRDGRFAIAGTDRSVALADVAARAPERMFRVSATETPSTPSWPNGAQVCEVEIDPQTGEIEVASLTSVDDIGRIINHMIVEGRCTAASRKASARRSSSKPSTTPASGQLLTGIADGLLRAARRPNAADEEYVSTRASRARRTCSASRVAARSARSAQSPQQCTRSSTRSRGMMFHTLKCRSRRSESGARCKAARREKRAVAPDAGARGAPFRARQPCNRDCRRPLARAARCAAFQSPGAAGSATAPQRSQ
jgi:carbon-monoxide dehydrogenase large subunit